MVGRSDIGSVAYRECLKRAFHIILLGRAHFCICIEIWCLSVAYCNFGPSASAVRFAYHRIVTSCSEIVTSCSEIVTSQAAQVPGLLRRDPILLRRAPPEKGLFCPNWAENRIK